MVTAFLFFAIGGLEALAIRLQLARPDNNLLSPDLYNQVFSVHGSTMMFLFAVPVMLAFGLYFVPLMIGTRNVAFPPIELIWLLRLSRWLSFLLYRFRSQHRRGYWLVQLCAAGRACVLTWKTGGYLGPDDYIH